MVLGTEEGDLYQGVGESLYRGWGTCIRGRGTYIRGWETCIGGGGLV